MAEPLAGRPFLRTFALVAVAMVGLSATDVFLANTERVESRAEAARVYSQGRELMGQGKSVQAIGRFKDALAAVRDNQDGFHRDYARSLAEAQLAAGQMTEAEGTISGLLETDSTDGMANLIMARALVRQRRFPEAVSYYHRAIYGQWKVDEPEKRLAARFELIDLLAQHNSKEELLAELLPIQDEAPQDRNTRLRIAQLFLQAGSPSRAADGFHGILREDGENGDAWEGLGEAEFAQRNYRAAERDFQTALRISPEDQQARQRLDACRELLELDPLVRGLSAAERFSRSLKLLQLTRSAAGDCASGGPPDLTGLLDRSAKALVERVSAARQSQAAEQNLDLAEQIWQTRRRCNPAPDPESPLALVMARLAQ